MSTCVIIENNQLPMNSLRNLIHADFSTELELVGIAATIKEGIELIQDKSPELVFLDIEFRDGNGFHLLSHFPDRNFEVIFVALTNDYAITAIKYSAVDYLIKPISMIDLRGAIIRFQYKKKSQKLNNSNLYSFADNYKMGVSHQKKIALPTAEGFQVLLLNEILYCHASENYTYLHIVTGERIIVTKTLKSIEEILSLGCFFRIHKSILLNINYVKSFSRKDGFMVTLENGQKFEIATRRQEEFINLFIKKTDDFMNKKENTRITGQTLN